MELGKLGKSRSRDAYGELIARGSKIDHGMERAHDILVDKLGLDSTVHNSKLTKLLPDKETRFAKSTASASCSIFS